MTNWEKNMCRLIAGLLTGAGAWMIYVATHTIW